MPIKKRIAKERNSRITPEAVELFRKITDLSAGNADAWEDDDPPGHHRELLDTSSELHRLLGRKPWQEHVEDAVGDLPSWLRGDDRVADYREAAALRLELIEALKQASRATRRRRT